MGTQCADRERSERVSRTSPGEIDTYIGHRVRQLRVSLGLSRSWLSQSLGITPAQIQKYEGGGCRIGAGRLYILARSFGVPIESFFEEIDAQLEQRCDDAVHAEVRELTRAFLSIPDDRTRQSFAALVLSLAERRAD